MSEDGRGPSNLNTGPPTGTLERDLQRQLDEAEERYRSVVAAIDQGFCILEMILDADGQPVDYRFLDVNAQFERHTGLRDVVGRTARQLVPDLEAHWVEAYGRVAETRVPETFRQGSVALGRAFEVSAMPVDAPEDRRVALLFRDVTELLRTVADLREREASLREALEAKDQFLGLVSHELRTPLTIVLGMSHLLAGTDMEPEHQREVAQDIAQSAEVLSDLLEAMLLLARLDQHEVDRLREPVVLDRVARASVDRAASRDPARSYELELVDRTLVVDVQRTWLERVIENLLGNAAKYSPPGTSVSVVMERDGRSARLRVLDRGPGLDPDEVEQVFDAFYRSPATRAGAPGVGLGLAVARRVVTLLGGRIWAQPRPGGGAEFGFELPLADDTD